MQLMTIGYEGLTSSEFFKLLLTNRVQTIIDVRELPLSRKPGFSKTVLSQAAMSHNLKYVHLSALGCPREIRHAYRADENWARYTKRFLAYLKTQNETVQALAVRVLSERCCLMCFEADPNFCHRSYVAGQIASITGSSLHVVHLHAKTQIQVVAGVAAHSSRQAGKPNRQ